MKKFLVILCVCLIAAGSMANWRYRNTVETTSTGTVSYTNVSNRVFQPYSVRVKFDSAATGSCSVYTVSGTTSNLLKTATLAGATDVFFQPVDVIGGTLSENDWLLVEDDTSVNSKVTIVFEEVM